VVPWIVVECLANASPDDAIGSNVKVEVFDQVRRKVGTFAEVFWNEVVVAATEVNRQGADGVGIAGYDRCKATNRAIDRVVRDFATDALTRLGVRARHAALRFRGLPRLLPRWRFDEVAVGSHDLISLGVYEYLYDVLAWRRPTEELRGLWAVAKSAGWMVPHENVCWICERPDVLRTDARGRLHCPDGSALRYPDGWSVYAWRGVQVPRWIIDHPERITLGKIGDTFEPVLRNCMIEIMTPERFIRSGGAGMVSRDDTGMLWRKFWSFRGVAVGSWSAVEVVNGTPETDGSHKHYFLRVPARMRTAREAVAWTYGLTADEYPGLVLRT
jgi:hypothetical protein